MKPVLIFIFIFSLSSSWSQSETPKVTLKQKVDRMKKVFQTKGQKGFLNRVSQVLNEDEKHEEALGYLAMYHIQRNHLGLARIIIERILSDDSRNSAAYNHRGLIEWKEGNKDKAVLDFMKSLKYDRSYFPALANLSSIYIKALDYQQALPLLRRAYSKVMRFPKITSSSNVVKIMHNYAVSLVWAQKFDDAIEVFEVLAKKKNVRINTLINYAQFLIESSEDLSEAKDILNKASFLAKNKRERDQVNRLLRKLRRSQK